MNLVQRVKRILLSPRTEWEVIEAEPTTPATLYMDYIVPLAAVGPIVRIIGYVVFGTTHPMGTYRVPIGSSILSSLIIYLLMLIAVYGLAVIVDELAPTFNGQRSRIQSLKLVAYSSTPAWVAGVFLLIPPLASLVVIIGALYSVYVLFLGLPKLMRAQPDKVFVYSGIVAVCAFVMFFVIGSIAGRFMPVPSAIITVP